MPRYGQMPDGIVELLERHHTHAGPRPGFDALAAGELASDDDRRNTRNLRAIALLRHQIPGAADAASIALRCLDRDVHAAYVAAEPVEMARRSQQKSRQPL